MKEDITMLCCHLNVKCCGYAFRFTEVGYHVDKVKVWKNAVYSL